MEALLELLVSTSTTGVAEAATDERLELLLADFLACARAGRSRQDAGPFEQDGVAGTAALLALRSSAADLDDVDWRSLHHPGSVVWPVVVALAMQSDSAGEPLGRAARAGYATAATIADHLGSTHRATWHVTATAGALGAASAASVMLDLPPAGHVRALALAAANLGGLALAARERLGAASFNRAAAATLGMTAARAASVGTVAVEAFFDAPDGLLQAMSGAGADGGPRMRGGVLEASARLYPVSGFLQSTVASIAALRAQVDGDLIGIRIGLSEGGRSLVDGGAGGPWWDARLSALRAWASGSPFLAGAPCSLDALVEIVEVYGTDLPPGFSDVTVSTNAGEASISAAGPPSLSDSNAQVALREKWTSVLKVDGHQVQELAYGALAGSAFGAELREAVLS